LRCLVSPDVGETTASEVVYRFWPSPSPNPEPASTAAADANAVEKSDRPASLSSAELWLRVMKAQPKAVTSKLTLRAAGTAPPPIDSAPLHDLFANLARWSGAPAATVYDGYLEYRGRGRDAGWTWTLKPRGSRGDSLRIQSSRNRPAR
jgi:hypothetical protein